MLKDLEVSAVFLDSIVRIELHIAKVRFIVIFEWITEVHLSIINVQTGYSLFYFAVTIQPHSRMLSLVILLTKIRNS
jgi:hypothetical protein